MLSHGLLSLVSLCQPAVASDAALEGAAHLADRAGQGLTKFFAAYKQISLIGSVPTKFTINSTTN